MTTLSYKRTRVHNYLGVPESYNLYFEDDVKEAIEDFLKWNFFENDVLSDDKALIAEKIKSIFGEELTHD